MISCIKTLCDIYNKDIKVVKYIYNFMYYEYYFDLKVYYHYKFKHHKKYMTNKGVIKRYFFMVILFVINILYLLIYSITYPIWALHEFLI